MKKAMILAVIATFAAVASATAAESDAAAKTQSTDMNSSPVRFRYIVNDVNAAVAFYTNYLHFNVKAQSGSYFAMLSRGDLQLVLSPPKGPGGASQPMPNGQRPEPGGWNRIILPSDNLERDVETLKKDGVKFRNNIVSGPGGKEILLEDPSGNPIELFQSTQ